MRENNLYLTIAKKAWMAGSGPATTIVAPPAFRPLAMAVFGRLGFKNSEENLR